MDQREPNSASQIPQTALEVNPAEASGPAAPTPDTRKPLFIFIVIFVVVGILILILLNRSRSSSNPTASPSPTVTPIASSPTPLRELSPIATSSAFLELSGQIASLSADIGRINLSDQSLTPPVVELPLGFSN